MARNKRALDGAARERLRQAYQRRKGRATLKSIDPAGWAMALDHAKELEMDGRLPAVRACADGDLLITAGDGSETRLAYQKLAAWRSDYERLPRGWTLHDVDCPWARLRYGRGGQADDLVKLFPSRKVCALSYRGRGMTTNVTVTVHPVPVVAAVFAFLWPGVVKNGFWALPETPLWVNAFIKYCPVYSDKYVRHLPGVGSRLRLLQRRGDLPAGSEVTVTFSNYLIFQVDGRVERKNTFVYGDAAGLWEVVG